MLQSMKFDDLPVTVHPDRETLGQASARDAAKIIQTAISERGEAVIILAAANSQLDFLRALREQPGIDWSRVRVFHMDEYLGISPDHPASFPGFLQRHFLDHVPAGEFHALSGDPADPERTCREYETLLRRYPADLVAMGFGENGHIAFNDPPYALFDDPAWVKTVQLDDVSRRQQVGEGHFHSLAEVPTHAITLTIPALLAPRHILCIVPEARKAEAVKACLTEPVDEARPGSILRTVTNAHLYLDTESASLLPQVPSR